jgi:hypothetical protein|tara:strand:- start:244 stop:705 length:462 start_codon:yes stop_codon:yes gene_type:complete
MNFDTKKTLLFIDSHTQRANIIAMYKKGPPVHCGFLFATEKNWENEQANAFSIMKKHILDAGYDSSGYAMMHRAVQKSLRERSSHTIEEVGIPDRSQMMVGGVFRPYPWEMDRNNAEAMRVMNSEGLQSAAKHMFTRPDGTRRSYSEMRSMYG